MVENLGRKLAWIGVLLAVSLGLVFLKDEPFRLGLDLSGGTRLVYRFDFEAAEREGVLSPEENRAEVLNQTIDIISRRVDPQGVLEPVIRAQGSDRVVIELPGTAALTGAEAQAELAEPVLGATDAIALGGEEEAWENFPASGGVVEIGAEKIRYERRVRNRLQIASEGRGQYGTEVSEHEPGATVELVSTNAIQNAIENLGELSFMIVANASDVDVAAERRKLEQWVAENPDVPIANFNAVPEAQGGPDPKIAWYPQTLAPDQEDPGELARVGPNPVIKAPYLTGAPQTDPGWRFTGADLGAVYYTSDTLGYPAVGFELQGPRKNDFREFTEQHEGRQMAIVLNDEITSAPSIDGPLPGGGIIRGRFTANQVNELITVLRTGSLRIKPILEAEEKVGPTLGAGYVQRGLWGGLIALASVLVFMTLYFRRLGFYSVLSLAASLVMLIGGLAFLQATLTLPGIAGIILTVGMAVDANILIFDRIREELDKGRNQIQSAKNGFDHAKSAILDANITTLLTALILYNVGTGPVRGFAVTLSIGILTSVFAALVITRVMVHVDLQKKRGPFRMGSWLATAKYDFLSKAKYALPVSGVLIVAGLALFVSLPTQTKLGIDFLGGASVQFRTQEPQTVAAIRERIATIPGDLGATAEVKPILATAEGEGYRSFRATVKATEGGEGGDAFRGELESVLEGVLQEDPVEVAVATDEAGQNSVELALHFEQPHPTDDVAAALRSVGLSQPVVTAGVTPADYRATATSAQAVDPVRVAQDVERAFATRVDPQGVAYTLASPIPESSVVGAQVVGELRDKAILALLVSLFVIVMYIRVRFAEYSYGLAAVAAVVHDVLLTLGALSALMATGLLQVEINLPMIAAFLTIIGYSLNDTIVMFDRVRENLPRVEGGLTKVLNLSINQTLSRTILTSLTTFLAVFLLFAFNVGTGNVLEGFSIAMVIGILAGTYSTIFLAAPVLLWLERRRRDKLAAESQAEAAERVPAAAR